MHKAIYILKELATKRVFKRETKYIFICDKVRDKFSFNDQNLSSINQYDILRFL